MFHPHSLLIVCFVVHICNPYSRDPSTFSEGGTWTLKTYNKSVSNHLLRRYDWIPSDM